MLRMREWQKLNARIGSFTQIFRSKRNPNRYLVTDGKGVKEWEHWAAPDIGVIVTARPNTDPDTWRVRDIHDNDDFTDDRGKVGKTKYRIGCTIFDLKMAHKIMNM